MLLYKGWLETRLRLLFSLAFFGIFLIQAHVMGGIKPPDGAKADPVKVYAITEIFLVATLCGMVAGAGIATQPAFQGAKGLHGSMLFTLSLPVSRFRLLAVRAGLGWLEMAGGIAAMCCGLWILFPVVRAATTVPEMLEYAGALIACGSGLYFVSVLLATFLDEQWRVFGNMISFAALWWLPNHTPLPASANVFRAMGEGSPLIAHSMPWTAMAFSLELAAILFFAALKIVQLKEY
jgi:ABC-2 type transport system permease protein